MTRPTSTDLGASNLGISSSAKWGRIEGSELARRTLA